VARFNRLELPDDPPLEPQSREAQTVSEKPEKRYRNSIADWMQEASSQRRMGFYEAALRSYGRALECERSHVAAWVGQAQMLILLNEPRQAEMWTISGLKMFPGNADLYAARSQALCRLGNHREALQYNDAAIQGEGASAYRWSVRGEVMTATKASTAAHCFDSAEQIDADWLVRTENANILRFYKNSRSALGRAAAAVNIAPDAPFAWMIKGICEHESGFRPQAIKSLEQALQLDPEFKEAKRWLTIVQTGTGGFLKRFFNLFRRR
jgi:tetratricopeptide (TPR) repeat protein